MGEQFESIVGVVERLTYHSSESGYSVARFKSPGNRDLLTIVGSFPNIQAGQTLKLTGAWREHPKFGQQFQVTQYQETKPATITGIEKYLGSGLIKGVGPVTAKRIVAHFGFDTLDIIEYSNKLLRPAYAEVGVFSSPKTCCSNEQASPEPLGEFTIAPRAAIFSEPFQSASPDQPQ